METPEDIAILRELTKPIHDRMDSLRKPIYEKINLLEVFVNCIGWTDENDDGKRQRCYYETEIKKLRNDINEIGNTYYPETYKIKTAFYKKKLGITPEMDAIAKSFPLPEPEVPVAVPISSRQ